MLTLVLAFISAILVSRELRIIPHEKLTLPDTANLGVFNELMRPFFELYELKNQTPVFILLMTYLATEQLSKGKSNRHLQTLSGILKRKLVRFPASQISLEHVLDGITHM